MATFTSLRRLPTRLSTPATRFFTTTPRASLAKMQIIGRLAAEPELTNTSTGREIVRYSLGTNHGPRDNQKTSWFNVTCFDDPGPRRDYLLNLPKGALIHLDADARMDSYDDSEGKRRQALNLVQRQIEVLSRPRPQEERSAAEEPSSGIGQS